MQKHLKLSVAAVLLAVGASLHAGEIIHDADYYVLEAQHKEQWIATDKTVDEKLAAFR
jgi:hypothetical protein